MMTLLMNLLWLFFGGWAAALSWFFAALIMFISIIGIPWAWSAVNIGFLTLWPFGSKVVSRKGTTGPDIGTGVLGFIGNIIWFVFAGWWLALFHLVCTVLLGITLIGIPFAIQHFKLARLSLMPIGKRITNSHFST
jgi:uncharacterized membrane protein YccF (DUF307 family)